MKTKQTIISHTLYSGYMW